MYIGSLVIVLIIQLKERVLPRLIVFNLILYIAFIYMGEPLNSLANVQHDLFPDLIGDCN